MSVSQIGSLCFIHKSIRGSGGTLFLRPRQPRPEESQPHQRLPTLRLWVPAASCPPCRLKPFWDFCVPVLLRLVRHLIFDNRNCDVFSRIFTIYFLRRGWLYFLRDGNEQSRSASLAAVRPKSPWARRSISGSISKKVCFIEVKRHINEWHLSGDLLC